MKLSTVALFWRDSEACCFTYFRFQDIDPLNRAIRIARTIERMSTLQLYCIIFNKELIPWQPLHDAPSKGTEFRLSFLLKPGQPLNPMTGIAFIKISIPGPDKSFTNFFKSNPKKLNHPYWPRLVKEVIPFLRLPNGLAVESRPGKRIVDRVVLMDILPEHRPQPGRPPVDRAISVTIRNLDAARSKLAYAKRARKYFEFELAQVERYQRKLEFLKSLHELEQQFWQQSQYAFVDDDVDELDPIEEVSLIVDKTRYLPCANNTTDDEWSDLSSADFINPNLWAPLSRLKDKFKITSRRSFWRTIARLREMGLRTLPAHQDRRLQLFFIPDLARIETMLSEITLPTTPARPPATTPQPEALWQPVGELRFHQQSLFDLIDSLQPADDK